MPFCPGLRRTGRGIAAEAAPLDPDARRASAAFAQSPSPDPAIARARGGQAEQQAAAASPVSQEEVARLHEQRAAEAAAAAALRDARLQAQQAGKARKEAQLARAREQWATAQEAARAAAGPPASGARGVRNAAGAALTGTGPAQPPLGSDQDASAAAAAAVAARHTSHAATVAAAASSSAAGARVESPSSPHELLAAVHALQLDMARRAPAEFARAAGRAPLPSRARARGALLRNAALACAAIAAAFAALLALATADPQAVEAALGPQTAASVRAALRACGLPELAAALGPRARRASHALARAFPAAWSPSLEALLPAAGCALSLPVAEVPVSRRCSAGGAAEHCVTAVLAAGDSSAASAMLELTQRHRRH